MPMLQSWRKPNHITGPNFFNRSTLSLHPANPKHRRAGCLVRGFRDATEERFAFELEKLLRLAETHRGARGENQRAEIAHSAELFAWIGSLRSRRCLPVPSANTA